MANIPLILGGANIALGLFDRFRASDLQKLQDDVLQRRGQYVDDLARRSRGKFTDAELEAQQSRYAPVLEQTSGALAGRVGVRSGAGAQILADTQAGLQQRDMLAADAQYGQALGVYSQELGRHLQPLQGDSSFIEDLGVIAQLNEMFKNEPDDDLDTEVKQVIAQGYTNPTTRRKSMGG